MDVKLYYSFPADGKFWHAECILDEDPQLSKGDTVEAVRNLWPATVDEINYVVEEEKKIYSLRMERSSEEGFFDRARQSGKWNLYSEE